LEMRYIPARRNRDVKRPWLTKGEVRLLQKIVKKPRSVKK